MKTALARIAAILSGAALLVLSVATFASPTDAANYPLEGQQYYLSGAGVTSSQVTVPLTSLKTPDGRAITMTMIGTKGYGTLEPQTVARVENITFTGITQNANGTAILTGVTRGLDFAYPYAAASTYRQSHSGGSTFIITNTPNWYYDQFAMFNDNVTTWPTASSSVPSKGYVDFVAFNGAGVINATLSSRGVLQLGTGAQAAASTALGSSGASLALATSISTSTYNAATAANVVVVTGVSGKIDNNFVSTSTLLAATSTINIGAFPAWQIGKQMQVFTSLGTSTFPVPSGITKVSVEVIGAGGGAGYSGGGAGGYGYENVDITGTSSIQVFIGTGGTGANGAGATAGTWSTFGTNGFYLSAGGGNPGTGGTASTCSSGTGGTASGGDINVSGDDGSYCSNGTTTFGGHGGVSSYGKTYGNGGNGAGAGLGTGSNGAPGIVIIRW